MFSYLTLEQRVPADHPLREIRKLTDEVLRSLSGEFDRLRTITLSTSTRAAEHRRAPALGTVSTSSGQPSSRKLRRAPLR
jgi:hypothetical protein